MRTPLALTVTLSALAIAAPASAFCPSYTASSPNNTKACGIEAADGVNPTTTEWNAIFDLVSQGPSVWGNAGPDVDDIGQGCGLPEPLHQVAARFPCELLKGIAMQESGWRQFCVPDTPSDQVGGNERTIISFDCGYGIGQVTSGMHVGETPSFDRELVASDPTYNLATGTQILASKWKATQCVGDNQPTVIEHWYIATWAYNGLSYTNNPNNPAYLPNRGVYDPAVGGAAPYQEKVFGWMEYTGGKWVSTALAYPNPGDIGGGSSPPQLPDPTCASPTDCINARPLHFTACDGSMGAGGSGGSEGSSSNGGAVVGASVGSGGETVSAGVGGGSSGIGGFEGDGMDPHIEDSYDGSCACRAGATPEGSKGRLAAILLGLTAAFGRRRRRLACKKVRQDFR